MKSQNTGDRPSLSDLGVTADLRAALAAAGLVIVPIEPTKKMLDEAWADAMAESASGVWREMVATARNEVT